MLLSGHSRELPEGGESGHGEGGQRKPSEKAAGEKGTQRTWLRSRGAGCAPRNTGSFTAWLGPALVRRTPQPAGLLGGWLPGAGWALGSPPRPPSSSSFPGAEPAPPSGTPPPPVPLPVSVTDVMPRQSLARLSLFYFAEDQELDSGTGSVTAQLARGTPSRVVCGLWRALGTRWWPR